MPQPYDLTNASNMGGVADLFKVANQVSNNSFGVVILLVTFFIIFMQLKNYQTSKAATAASFLTSILAVLLFVLGMISQAVLVTSIVLTAVIFALNMHED